MKKSEIRDYVRDEANLIDCDISYRGGTLKIDVSDLFPSVVEAGEEAVIGASQGYLGGGIAGAISGGAKFDPSILNKAERRLFDALLDEAKKYFFDLNNGGGDEYMQEESGQTYESVQRRSVSAY